MSPKQARASTPAEDQRAQAPPDHSHPRPGPRRRHGRLRARLDRRQASARRVGRHTRWVIERTFGWLMQYRRLARDCETLPQRSREMVHWAMADQMSRELTGESTPTWRIHSGETTNRS
ncbi:transposase [Streptomyces sp. NPDC102441]|uniref:transposase n=1 Tax=Streptomyces sp. NPDC102441 TaxID=3366176 RepID=UPI00380F3E64